MNVRWIQITVCVCAGVMIHAPAVGKDSEYIDDFEDGIVDPDIYQPIDGAIIVEVDGQLVVTPIGPSGGVLINIRLPMPAPVSSSNLVEEWQYEITMTPTFTDEDIGTMTMESMGSAGRVIDRTLYDNETDTIFVSEGDRFGGVQTLAVATFMPNLALREAKKHTCRWIPPGWSSRKCCYYIIPPVVYWKFGEFGDAPLDASLNDVGLTGIRLVSTDPFAIDRVQINFGDDVGGIQAWTLTPSHVQTIGGDTVTVTGQGFTDLGDFTITVNDVPAEDVMVIDDSTITFETPPGSQGLALLLLETSDESLAAIFENDLRYYGSPAPLLLRREPLQVGRPGTPYSEQITASGGTGTLDFSLTSGTFPPGVTLQSDGTLSGTPTDIGVFASFVAVADQSGEEDVRMFLLEVQAGVPSLSKWGLMVMTLLLLTAATIVVARRRWAVVA